jgi:membrane-associated phospholipid phosphatase
VLPLAGLVALALAAIGRWRVSLAWLAAVAATLAAMAALKLLAFSLPSWLAGAGLAPGDLGNPSGHAAAGTICYGGLATLLWPRPARRPWPGLLAGAAAALVFGGTRLWLGVHSVPDVLTGGAVGLAGVLLLARLAGRAAGPPVPVPGLALVLAVVLGGGLVFHGTRLYAEGLLRALAAGVLPPEP